VGSNFIDRLEPTDIRDADDLKNKVCKELAEPNFHFRRNHTRDLIGRLIFHQFPEPPLDAVRELLSNARDAQVRAGREGQPLVLTLDKNRLRIIDKGDGMDAARLAIFFASGRSSGPF
jgi:hypothetical protein